MWLAILLPPNYHSLPTALYLPAAGSYNLEQHLEQRVAASDRRTWLCVPSGYSNNARASLVLILCFTSIELESQQTSASRRESTPRTPPTRGLPCPARAPQHSARPQSSSHGQGSNHHRDWSLLAAVSVSSHHEPHSDFDQQRGPQSSSDSTTLAAAMTLKTGAYERNAPASLHFCSFCAALRDLFAIMMSGNAYSWVRLAWIICYSPRPVCAHQTNGQDITPSTVTMSGCGWRPMIRTHA